MVWEALKGRCVGLVEFEEHGHPADGKSVVPRIPGFNQDGAGGGDGICGGRALTVGLFGRSKRRAGWPSYKPQTAGPLALKTSHCGAASPRPSVWAGKIAGRFGPEEESCRRIVKHVPPARCHQALAFSVASVSPR